MALKALYAFFLHSQVFIEHLLDAGTGLPVRDIIGARSGGPRPHFAQGVVNVMSGSLQGGAQG